MKHNKGSLVMLFIVILIMASIFVFSSHTGNESSALSIKVTRFISKIIFRRFGSMSADEQQFIVTQLHPFIRKLAHFTIYLMLGTALYLSIALSSIKIKGKFPAAWAICILYASADEYHQSLTPGRSMRLTDVLIDSSGAFCGLILAAILIIIFKYIKNEFFSQKK